MAGCVTIRGGVVFVASDAVLQNVSIFGAQVVCPTNSTALPDLTQSLYDRAAGNVTVQDCHLVSFSDHAQRQYRSAAAKAGACASPIGGRVSVTQKGGA